MDNDLRKTIIKWLELNLSHELVGTDLETIVECLIKILIEKGFQRIPKPPPTPLPRSVKGYQPEDKTLPPGERPKPPKMPSGSGVTILRDKSKDNEIKMQMAKDILCHTKIGNDCETLEDTVKKCCDLAEQIFNRFNK